MKFFVFLSLLITSISTLSSAKQVDAEGFRQIFESILKSPSDQLLYGLPSTLQEIPNATSAQDFLNQINTSYSVDPQVLFTESQKSKPAKISYDKIVATLAKNPLTIVVVPGIFGEFITTPAFEEVFSANSSFKTSFEKRMDESNLRDANFELKRIFNLVPADFEYSYENLLKTNPQAFVTKPLKNFFLAGSIDDVKGNPLVKVILFNTPALSLESLSDIHDVGQIFTRRLQKLISALDAKDTQNLVFLGYSRGTDVGLDMLANAKKNSKPWLANVKAFISLGGVTYGSDLADLMNVPGSASNVQLTAVSKLINSLKYTSQTSDAFLCKNKCENNKAWLELLKTVAPTLPSLSWNSVVDLYNTVSEKRGFDFNSTLSLTLYLAKEFGLVSEDFSVSSFFKDAKNVLDLGYDFNISKFRIFVKSLLIAAPQLTTKARTEWWSNNIIPANIHYYAIAGTLADPAVDQTLAQSQVGSGPFYGQDYKSLLANYRDFEKIAHAKLNDSQMSTQKVRFWPELNILLNPNQEKFSSTFLGVFGAHHWALALSVVNANKDGTKNPFPRTQLLESLAATVATDLKN